MYISLWLQLVGSRILLIINQDMLGLSLWTTKWDFWQILVLLSYLYLGRLSDILKMWYVIVIVDDVDISYLSSVIQDYKMPEETMCKRMWLKVLR